LKENSSKKVKGFLLNSPCEEYSLLLGEKIGTLLEAGDILALRGELASGKTLLTRGIARGLGVSPEVRVTSPTFTIINEYQGRLCLFHLDLYRIAGIDELDTLPWREALFGSGAAAIEWPDRLGRLLPGGRWDIELSIIDDENRAILIRGRGPKNRRRMAKWAEVLDTLRVEAPCQKEE
jgi:tRNA threonylcarbamoyladenosine biosynthesis protein TsaE